jgi:hypothetical protein
MMRLDGTGRVDRVAICSWPTTLRLCLILIVRVVAATLTTIMVIHILVLLLFMK